jgi:hypothetical protein
MLQSKYLILLWIIILIIFTFYCIYRLSRINQPTTSSNNFENIVQSAAQSAIQTQPTQQNLINYITAEQEKNRIIDIPGCQNVYDDNIAVRALGYNNCATANADYYHRNLDINNKYGRSKSLAEICPVSTNTDAYLNCMQLLLNKFNTNANMLDKINGDMASLVNKRLSERSDILNSVDIAVNPLLYSKEQVDFKRIMQSGESLNPTPDQILENVDKYYSAKYGFSKSVFANINTPKDNSTVESFASNLEIYNVDPYIDTTFFGIFTPIKGQFLAFNNITVSLNYDTTTDTEILDNGKKIILTVMDNNTNSQLVYQVVNIDFYQQYKNVIKIDLFDQTINSSHSSHSSQPDNNQTLQQLLTTLGITVPNRIIMSMEEFTSSENITRKTYKLMNANMSTIMILEKQ